jgi:hypothetical protein
MDASLAKVCALVFLSFLSAKEVRSQETWAIGASLNYNLPLETAGAGLRARIPLVRQLALVPKLRYAPAYNAIHEADAGLNLQYSLWDNSERGGPAIYLSAGAVYNRWLNYKPSANDKAQENNFLPEAGAGFLMGRNKFKFFAEGHWNMRWNESYVDVGVLFYPSAQKSRKALRCIYY